MYITDTTLQHVVMEGDAEGSGDQHKTLRIQYCKNVHKCLPNHNKLERVGPQTCAELPQISLEGNFF